MGYGDEIMLLRMCQHNQNKLCLPGKILYKYFSFVVLSLEFVELIRHDVRLINSINKYINLAFFKYSSKRHKLSIYFFMHRQLPDVHFVEHYPGNRVYIDKHKSNSSKLHFLDLSSHVLFNYQMHWSAPEASRINDLRYRYRNHIIIEPKIKATTSSSNKDWGLPKYMELAEILNKRGFKILEIGSDVNEKKFLNSEFCITDNFRDACLLLSSVSCYVGPEGGLHHAAALLGTPAVVIFGGFISPKVTGYSEHINFYIDDSTHPYGCGNLKNCMHCKDAMKLIEVEHVLSKVLNLLQ